MEADLEKYYTFKCKKCFEYVSSSSKEHGAYEPYGVCGYCYHSPTNCNQCGKTWSIESKQSMFCSSLCNRCVNNPKIVIKI
jgi:hypothetical protein